MESVVQEIRANLAEAVYLPEVAKTTEDRLNEAFQRIQALEGKSFASEGKPLVRSENWLKINSYWFWPALALVVGSGALFSFSRWFFDDAVNHRIDSKLEQPAKDIHQIQLDVAKIGSKIDVLQDFLKPQIQKKLNDLAGDPSNRDNQAVASALINQAQQGSLPAIPVSIIEEAGKSFLGAAANDAGAWMAALDFVKYRSTLNTPPINPVAVPPQTKSGVANTNWVLNKVPGKPIPEMKYVSNQALPQAQAARAEFLPTPPAQTTEMGVGTFVMVGGALNLDSMHLRRVILLGVEVHYSGAPMLLDDVSFVNCIFVMDNAPRTRELASSILQSSSVNLDFKS